MTIEHSRMLLYNNTLLIAMKFSSCKFVISTAAILLLLHTYVKASAQSASSTPDNSAFILTPPAPESPQINGPKIYGARPDADFLYRIPATGVRPMTFSAEGLPKGLKLNPETGIITGKVRHEGTYEVTLHAKNAKGRDNRTLRIVIGDKIALTPPMGWNSWNCWGNIVSQEKVMSSAKAMIEKGLVEYGWSYINIDDGWQGLRGGKYNAIQPNSKFGDMKALGDSLHAFGLKFGIYSGPWTATYAGHIGESSDTPDGKYDFVEKGIVDEYWKLDRSKLKRDSLWYFTRYRHELSDARQWSDWGVDYLKYDWNPNDHYHLKLMSDALAKADRDIVYSISNSSHVSLGASLKKYAQCWRTTGDIRDSWESMSKIGFEGQDRWAGFREPGNWPDADMLVVGKVGWGPKTHWTKLTPDEQFTHISLWAMMASPLLIGCDMAELDDFTISLLCNREIIDINQDELGLQAVRIYGNETYATYLKPLSDGSVAIAMFNLSDKPQKIGFIPKSLKLVTTQIVRDVWRQKDIAEVKINERWETEVAPHGVCVVKLSPGYINGPISGFVK